MSSYPRTHFFLVWCSIESRVRRGRAQGSAWGGELGQYFYKCPSEYGQCWIPCSLVAASVPQNFFNVWTLRKRRDLLYTNHTVLISQQTNCSMSSAHERFVHYLVQRKKKCFLECLCMNLNFKLFLFCFIFFLLKAQTYFERKSYVNIWFISYPGDKRFMCGYSIKSNVFDWRDVLQDWGSSTQIWISALWMYYSSVLNPVECSSAWLFNFLRCRSFFLFIYYYNSFIGPYTLKKKSPRKSCSIFFFFFLSTNKTVYSAHSTHRSFYFLCFGFTF